MWYGLEMSKGQREEEIYYKLPTQELKEDFARIYTEKMNEWERGRWNNEVWEEINI